MDADTLQTMWERSQAANPDKMQFTPEEASKFQKSFQDPEFRKLFSEYMDELQDPKNREENEMYISQLEGENKVPAGKELIRPEASFVAKTRKNDKKDPTSQEKLFLNIVHSDKISAPTQERTSQGSNWSVPYSLGPPHMEKDKSGDNAACFDCCFHPEALALGAAHKQFKDLLVHTAMEGVEGMYTRQGQQVTLDREYRVVKGIQYKSGQVPTMMISVAAKDNWNITSEINKETQNSSSTTTSAEASAASTAAAAAAAAATSHSTPATTAAAANNSSNDGEMTPSSAATIVTGTAATNTKTSSTVEKNKKNAKSSSGPAIKKGFFANARTSIYEDKIDTIRPKTKPTTAATSSVAVSPPISLVDQAMQDDDISKLNIPSSGTMGKQSKKKIPSAAPVEASSSSSLIQEVKEGESTSTTSNVDEKEKKVQSKKKKDVLGSATAGGLTAVSTTKKVPPPPPLTSTTTTSAMPTAAAGPSMEDEQEDTTSSGDGLHIPTYTVKERGHISMGDFDGLSGGGASNPRSSRPNELVYRINLPKIAKASHIALDIAERELKLTYPDVYSLSLRLPYPVFDSKGTAKYDKSSKSLTVTLPVRPPAPPANATRSTGTGTAVAGEEEEGEGDCEDGKRVEELPPSSSPSKQPIPSSQSPSEKSRTTSAVKHSRWVATPDDSSSSGGGGGGGGDKDAAVVGSDGVSKQQDQDDAGTGGSSQSSSPSKPLSLSEEIRRKAEQALVAAKAKQLEQSEQSTHLLKQTAATACAPPSPPPSTTSTHTSTPAAAASAGSVSFLPSASFAGRKEGYVFKRGEEGVGYYLDAKQSPASSSPPPPATTTPATKTSTSVAANTTAATKSASSYKEFPFECRQTKAALAVLVQVPYIDASSVSVEFQSHSVSIRFKALSCEEQQKVDKQEEGGQTSSFGLVLQLSAHSCPQGLNAQECKYDVAAKNMVLVLVKAVPQYWHPPSSSQQQQMQQQELVDEAKGAEADSIEAGALITTLPYAGKENTTTTSTSTTSSTVPAGSAAAKVVMASSSAEKDAKTLQAYENTIRTMQFDSSEALFELD